jgi:hypothetical protein
MNACTTDLTKTEDQECHKGAHPGIGGLTSTEMNPAKVSKGYDENWRNRRRGGEKDVCSRLN